MKINQILLGVAFALLVSLPSFSQGEIAILPVYSPKSVQLRVLANDEPISNQKYISRQDASLQVQAYANGAYENSELKIPELTVDLVRKGELISSLTIPSSGDISSLLNQAQDNDIVNFATQKVLIKNDSGDYDIFTVGRVGFYFEFRSSKKLVMN